jgi:hypothetical protein
MVEFACMLALLATITCNRAVFTYTNGYFVFETVSSERQGHNLIHCFNGKKERLR